jgi:hypothetical protein
MNEQALLKELLAVLRDIREDTRQIRAMAATVKKVREGTIQRRRIDG